MNKDQNYEQPFQEWTHVITAFKKSIKLEAKYKFNDHLKTKMTSWIDSLIIRCIFISLNKIFNTIGHFSI